MSFEKKKKKEKNRVALAYSVRYAQHSNGDDRLRPLHGHPETGEPHSEVAHHVVFAA